jgi:phosphatidate phosphatase APP1
MAAAPATRSLWLEQTADRLRALSASAGETFEAGLRRLQRPHDGLPYHIDAYRGMVDGNGHCRLAGRVLARPIGGGPRSDDDWWDNLLNSYRRFDAERLPGAHVDVTFRGVTASATTDAEGYYEAAIALPAAKAEPASLWEMAEVRRSEGGPAFLQSVLCVPPGAKFGLISDIDDTVMESNVSHWQTAIQTTFLRNARTRKPLEGVGELYASFQKGRDGSGPNPVFYVSASPWNVYDLLVDFMELNGIPAGPIMLRDIDIDRASLLHNAGPHSKLAKIHDIIERFPALQWVLVGDSGQIDAELYAQTVLKYPGRVLAVYIRDIDPTSDSACDQFVDSHIQQVASAKVPMLRVANGNAIAEHARTLGLIAPEQVKEVAKDVARDQSRPDVKHAVQEGLAKEAHDAVASVAHPGEH